MNRLDNFINECDIALKTLSFKKSGTGRSYPANKTSSSLSKKEKSLSAQLMRINLAGEVAAQALYRGQAMVCKDAEIKNHLVQAGEEETDHLIWCKKRLDELNGNHQSSTLFGMQDHLPLVQYLEALVKKLV